MKKLTTILFLLFSLSYLSAQESAFLRQLFDSSDVVVQGVIASTHCIGYSYGVEECSYKVRVDSIYKGFPKTYSTEFVLGFEPDDGPRQNLDIIKFTRDCFIGEDCPHRNQNVILFLWDNQTKGGYRLVDRWLGWNSYNIPLVEEIRKMKVIKSQ